MKKHIPYSFCQYGNHPIDSDSHSGYVYTDKTHGIPDDIRICKKCYQKHILKFWPDSRMAQYIREQEKQLPLPLEMKE